MKSGPSGSGHPPQRWTLTFRDSALERAYRLDRGRALVRQHRIVWLASAILAATPTLADLTGAGSARNLHLLLLVRFGFLIPILLGVAAFGWASTERFARGRDLAVALGAWAVVVYLAGAAALLPDPAAFRMRDAYFSVMIGLFFPSVALSLRFALALPLVLTYGAAVLAMACTRLPEPDPVGLVFWVALGAALSLIAGRQIEQAQRGSFLARRRSDQLLYDVLPEAIAERLKRERGAIADAFDAVTILFADIVGFTPLSATMTPQALVALLNEVFSAFDELARRHGLEKIKTIGDAYMVVGGLPEPRDGQAAAVAAMALEMRTAVSRLGQGRLSLRIGLHTGPVVAGVIGTSKYSYDLWGDAVNTASRMESHGAPGEIHVTDACRAALGDGFVFEERGIVEIKGKGAMHTWWLRGREPGRSRAAPGP